MKIIIGICGTTASGKDIAGDYISKELKIPLFEFSSPVIEEAKNQGLEITRNNLIRVGEKMAEKEGRGFPVKRFLEKIKERAIITGIRSPENIDFIRENNKLILISIDAKPEIRFQRARQRNKLKEAETIKEFKKYEDKEKQSPGLNVWECMKKADYKVENNLSLEELKNQLDFILKKESLI